MYPRASGRVPNGTWVADIPPSSANLPGGAKLVTVARNTTREDAFVVDKTGAIVTTWRDANIDAGFWHPWTSVTAPAHRLEVYAIANNGGILQQTRDFDSPGAWSGAPHLRIGLRAADRSAARPSAHAACRVMREPSARHMPCRNRGSPRMRASRSTLFDAASTLIETSWVVSIA